MNCLSVVSGDLSWVPGIAIGNAVNLSTAGWKKRVDVSIVKDTENIIRTILFTQGERVWLLLYSPFCFNRLYSASDLIGLSSTLIAQRPFSSQEHFQQQS